MLEVQNIDVICKKLLGIMQKCARLQAVKWKRRKCTCVRGNGKNTTKNVPIKIELKMKWLYKGYWKY